MVEGSKAHSKEDEGSKVHSKKRWELEGALKKEMRARRRTQKEVGLGNALP